MSFSNTFLAANMDKLPAESVPVLRERLATLSKSEQESLMGVNMKNPQVALILSIFLGQFGVDRFYIGHIGLGFAKLFLSWLTLGIWPLVDWFLIMNATKRENYKNLSTIVSSVIDNIDTNADEAVK